MFRNTCSLNRPVLRPILNTRRNFAAHTRGMKPGVFASLEINMQQRGENVTADTAIERGPVARFLNTAADAGRVPGFAWTSRFSHWLIRIPIAAVIWTYGIAKFPAAFTNPGDFGVPGILYTLNALGEVLGVIALLVGGVIETWNPRNKWLRLSGDFLTRSAGFALAAALGGVIVYFYLSALSLQNPHVMQLGIAMYLMFRGNNTMMPPAVEAHRASLPDDGSVTLIRRKVA
ncbi:MAG: hypothetical protein AAF610_14135 [Pseudomonadota bacterium]